MPTGLAMLTRTRLPDAFDAARKSVPSDMAPLEDIARATADRHRMLPDDGPVLAMVSGGGDSMALLQLLCSGALGPDRGTACGAPRRPPPARRRERCGRPIRRGAVRRARRAVHRGALRRRRLRRRGRASTSRTPVAGCATASPRRSSTPCATPRGVATRRRPHRHRAHPRRPRSRRSSCVWRPAPAPAASRRSPTSRGRIVRPLLDAARAARSAHGSARTPVAMARGRHQRGHRSRPRPRPSRAPPALPRR